MEIDSQLLEQLEDSDAEMHRLQERLSTLEEVQSRSRDEELNAEIESLRELLGEKTDALEMAEQRENVSATEYQEVKSRLNGENRGLRSELSKATSKHESLEQKCLFLTQEVADLRRRLDSDVMTIETLEQRLEDSKSLLEFADAEHGIMLQALAKHKSSEQATADELGSVKQKLNELDAILQDERRRNGEEQRRLNEAMTTVQDDHAALQLEYDDLIDTKTNIAKSLALQTQLVHRRDSELAMVREQYSKFVEGSDKVALKELHNVTKDLEARVSRRERAIAVEQAKLKKAEMNLTMAMQDITELEAQVTALNEELSSKAVALTVMESELGAQGPDLSATVQEQKEALAACRAVEATLRLQLQGEQDALLSLQAREREQMEKADVTLAQWESRYHSLSLEFDQATLNFSQSEDTLNVAVLEITHKWRELKRADETAHTHLSSLRIANEKISSLQSRLRELEEQHVLVQTEKRNMADSLAQREEDIRHFKDQIADWMNQQDETSLRLTSSQEESNTLRQHMSEKETELAAALQESSTLEARLSQQENLLQESLSKRAQMEEQIKELNQQLTTYQQVAEQTNKSLAELSREKFESQAEVTQLRDDQLFLEQQIRQQDEHVKQLEAMVENAKSGSEESKAALQAKYVHKPWPHAD